MAHKLLPDHFLHNCKMMPVLPNGCHVPAIDCIPAIGTLREKETDGLLSLFPLDLSGDIQNPWAA